MIDKYNIGFDTEVIKKNVQRLTNQLWKLIPMREHEEDWQKQLDTVIIEITGLNEIFMGPVFLQLLSNNNSFVNYDNNKEINYNLDEKKVL